MGSRGVNNFSGSGNVASPKFASTYSGEECASFVMVMEDKGRKTTTVRVNVYGGLVRVCRARLEKGVYVVVSGELMNRSERLTEVRAKDLAFP